MGRLTKKQQLENKILQREQFKIMEMQREIDKVMELIKDGLNELKVEELHLVSNAVDVQNRISGKPPIDKNYSNPSKPMTILMENNNYESPSIDVINEQQINLDLSMGQTLNDDEEFEDNLDQIEVNRPSKEPPHLQERPTVERRLIPSNESTNIENTVIQFALQELLIDDIEFE